MREYSDDMVGVFEFHPEFSYFAIKQWKIRGINIYRKCDTQDEMSIDVLTAIKDAGLIESNTRLWFIRFEGTVERDRWGDLKIEIIKVLEVWTAEKHDGIVFDFVASFIIGVFFIFFLLLYTVLWELLVKKIDQYVKLTGWQDVLFGLVRAISFFVVMGSVYWSVRWMGTRLEKSKQR